MAMAVLGVGWFVAGLRGEANPWWVGLGVVLLLAAFSNAVIAYRLLRPSTAARASHLSHDDLPSARP